MVKGIDIELARRAWVAVMGTQLEREARAAYLRVLEQAKSERTRRQYV